MDIAERLIEYRAENHLTQSEFAKLIGVNPLTIHRVEKSGKCSKTTKFLIEKVINKTEV